MNATKKWSSNQPAIYQIVLEGQLSSHWSNWFNGFTLTLNENGQTILIGPIPDQAALHGLLKRIRDLGLPLVSVSRLNTPEG